MSDIALIWPRESWSVSLSNSLVDSDVDPGVGELSDMSVKSMFG